MKSKSFDKRDIVVDKIKQNKSFDFVKFYKSSAETNVNPSPSEDVGEENNFTLTTAKRKRSPNKIKNKKTNETLDLSNIKNVASPSENALTDLNSTKVTSTPNLKGAIPSDSNVKSIMKNKARPDDSMDGSFVSVSSGKPKKRNKSVSFLIEDIDEVATKKTKANESVEEDKNAVIKNKDKLLNKKIKKEKKDSQAGKENKSVDQENVTATLEGSTPSKTDKVSLKAKRKLERVKDSPVEANVKEEVITTQVNKKENKAKKSKNNVDNATTDPAADIMLRPKKSKKKKHGEKPAGGTDAAEGEPAVKASKKDKYLKPDTIAKGLESLNIGDNAHTLTNLLDEMTVANKNKRKRDNKKLKKANSNNTVNKPPNPVVEVKTGVNKVTKEPVKWAKRKWNKDRTAHLRGNKLLSSVVVKNLPITIMCRYKTLLSEHFSKFGPIAGVGVAETNPSEDTKLVFTTTIYFQDEESATKALEEDNLPFEGSRIRVQRPLPARQTTLFACSYGALSEQALCSLFAGAGRLRSIHVISKGTVGMNKAFVEFDGPETVERAIKVVEEVQKIDGKRIYVTKYDDSKSKKHKPQDSTKEENGVESDSDE